MSLIEYLARIITAFSREAMEDKSSSNSKWRSAYLEFHFAMALKDSAFTKEMQDAALKEMKRTWAHFKEKRAFKKVQGRKESLYSFIHILTATDKI